MNKTWHKKRQRAEKRFRLYGISALSLAVIVLVLVIFSLTARGYSGFLQTQIRLPVVFDAAIIGADAPISAFNRLTLPALKTIFPKIADEGELRQLTALFGNNGVHLKRAFDDHPEWLGKTVELWLPTSSATDLYRKSSLPLRAKTEIRLSDRQIEWFKTLQEKNLVRLAFNTSFFTGSDSRAPEQAGFLGSIVGSVLTLIVCLLVSFPLGVMTAVYLEEFARKSRFVDFVEVNINNLAAVPSIVFGLLGLAVYINVMGLPRSAPVVGGLTLALMILPVIIIATRTSLSAIPGSIRDAARALGASPLQVVWHHTLPLSMPGIMTGTILGLARAIGETAPLLMIGMVAFVADVPGAFTSPATVMPVQIYLWASSPEAGFAEKTAAGILVLLVLLLLLNALAIYLRKRFEVRW